VKRKRRHWGVLARASVLARQAICPLCGLRIGALDNCDFDHEIALSIGGADDLANLRAVHKYCHTLKTFGSPATTAGSDIANAAKAKRLTKEQAAFRARLLAKEPGREKPKSKWPSRSFPKRGRK
jgi:5-methylcytosine-specific restriction endonuclease McrA